MKTRLVPCSDILRQQLVEIAKEAGVYEEYSSRFANFLHPQTGSFEWVLLVGDKLAGLAVFTPKADACWLDVFVMPAYWGRWATFRTFRIIAEVAFSNYGAHAIAVVTSNPSSARILAHQRFIPYAVCEHGACFVLYKHMLHPRIRNGKPV
jgi:hypothetical protein